MIPRPRRTTNLLYLRQQRRWTMKMGKLRRRAAALPTSPSYSSISRLFCRPDENSKRASRAGDGAEQQLLRIWSTLTI
ncbi:unnamed protein product [Linum trigynum]|uniref:Uncharacterized protein n=1 Tax=Linum trigynum TaxID=586398 RepID=A0AAV2FSI7_9ROSI